MTKTFAGTLVNVEDDVLGSFAAADYAPGATFITVADIEEFDFDGGQVQLPNGQFLAYTVPTDLSGLTLAAPGLTAALATGAPVNLYPPSSERWASVVPPGGTEPLPVRVPIGLRDRVWLGVRDQAVGEDVRYMLDDAEASNDHVLSDVLADEPVIDASMASTLRGQPSDGLKPASSPTPSLIGAATYLGVSWAAIANADRVVYEIHISTSNGFVPDATTKAFETVGTSHVITNLPSGAALALGTTYYVKLIAKDWDGSAPASIQASGALVPLPSSAQASDGVVPSSSPTPTVQGGPNYLVARWTPITNADPVTYEVHVSATSGFTPSGATKYLETSSASTLIKDLPSGGGPLVYGTTYYVRLIAKDADGSATAGVQGSAAMVQIDGASDVVAHSIVANDISVTNLAALSADLGAITAGTITLTGSPAYIRTAAADPKVQMDSTGLVVTNASGNRETSLDSTGLSLLLAGSGLPTTRTIRWLTSGGVMAGRLVTYSPVGTTGTFQAQAIAPVTTNAAEVLLEAKDTTDGDGVGTGFDLFARKGSGAGSNYIYARVRGYAFGGKTLLDQTGASDWVLGSVSGGTGISVTSGAVNPSVAIDTAVVPQLAVANTFSARQTFAPATDIQAALFRRGTDTSPTSGIVSWTTAAGTQLGSITQEGYGNFPSGVGTQVAAGAVTDANYGTQAASGSLGLDTSNKRLYARSGATWYFIPLSTVAPPNYATAAYTVRRSLPSSASATLAQVADVLATLVDDFGASGAGNGLLS
jgi:hypothetical protein